VKNLVGRAFFPQLCLVAILVGLAVFGFAIGVLMTPPTEIVGMDRLSELTCLQMAATPERALTVLNAFDANQQQALQQLLIPGDVIFAWGYGLVFAGVLGLLTTRMTGRWLAAGSVLMWAPLCASLFDVFEDLGLHSMVTNVVAGDGQLSSLVVLFTTVFASVKYLLLAGVGPIYGFAGVAKAATTDRRLRSIGLYCLVLLVALSMVQKPIAEIPACF
jgi:hypothetical protein